MRDRIVKVLSLVLVVLCMAGIFWFSAQPAGESSQTSGGITNTVISIFFPDYDTWNAEIQQNIFETVDTVIRKLAHFSVYALLGALCMFAASRFFEKRIVQLSIAGVVSVLYAAGDEFHQYFVPGRSCEFRDVCIDAAGACLGILFVWLLLCFAVRIKSRRFEKRI